MITILQRDEPKSDRTTGILTLPDGETHRSIEPLWNNNSAVGSCVPAGTYAFMRETIGVYQYFKLINVPKRSGIELHLGTHPSQTKGDILLPEMCLERMKLVFYPNVDEVYSIEIRD